MGSVIIPIVDSPTGRRALELAQEEATEHGDELVLVGTANVDEHLSENVETVRDLLEHLEKELAEAGVMCRTEWRVGESLGEATLELAEEVEARIIVLALRRRTPVGKALLGSYEQEILLNANTLVLCVPPEVTQVP